jgi:biuret amidohydrolase
LARTCCRKLRNIGSAAGRPADGGVDDAIDPPLPIATSLEEVCDPRRLALLIYDMQVGICQQVSCGPTITEACKRLRDRCRAAGVPVAYSRHLLLPAHWMGPFQTPRAMAWQRVDAPDAVKPWFLAAPKDSNLCPTSPRQKTSLCSTSSGCPPSRELLCSSLCANRGITILAICGIALEIGRGWVQDGETAFTCWS